MMCGFGDINSPATSPVPPLRPDFSANTRCHGENGLEMPYAVMRDLAAMGPNWTARDIRKTREFARIVNLEDQNTCAP